MPKLYRLLVVPIIFGLIFLAITHSGTQIATFKSNQLLNQAKQQFDRVTEISRRQNETLKLPILLYHYVEMVTDRRDTIRQSLSISPHIFESQVVTLLDNGYTPITLNDLENYWEGKIPLADKPIILTFDDGYRDFYTDVFPVLKKYHVPAVLFMVSGFVDSTKNYLTHGQLQEIVQSGLVEVGAHSVNHFNLIYVTPIEAKNEIVQSKKDLEKLLGIQIQHFAYPYGGHTPYLEKMVQDAGLQTSSSTNHGIMQSYKERFDLKRIRPGSSTGDYFLSLIK